MMHRPPSDPSRGRRKDKKQPWQRTAICSIGRAAATRSAAKDKSYTARDIEVLEGLEPVRKRPGMYVGGTDERALHHLVAEVLDNAMDEAVSGHADTIYLEMLAGNKVLVRDNGRGIPVDPHPKYKNKSALEVILTDAAFRRQVQQQGLRHLRRPARRRRLGGQRLVRRAGRRGGARPPVVDADISRGKPKTKLKSNGPAPTGAAPRSPSIPIRRSSASRLFVPERSTAWRAPRPTCSAASRSAGNATRACCPKAARSREESFHFPGGLKTS
jgi:topoisomerase-4 subunit B